MGDKSRSCMCTRRRQKLLAARKKDRCRRLRQTLVCDQEEEFTHEPYMQFLRDEYAPPPPSECNSEIELPWKELAISASELAGMNKSNEAEEKIDETEAENTEVELVRKESSGLIHLPWEELVITDTLQSDLAKKGLSHCDSTLEIPWEDILYDSNLKIEVSDEEAKQCDDDEVEIPWKDLLIPENIALSPRKKCPPISRNKIQKKSKKCGCSKTKR